MSIFSSLANIFSSNSISSVSFFDFYNKIVYWQKNSVYPFPSNLPAAISLPNDFWHDVFSIHKLTIGDGRERAISIYWVDGELLVTSVTKGNESSVKTNEKISVRYVPHPARKGYYRKEILVNGSTVKKLDVYKDNVPKSVDLKYLFNMHTHPKDQNGQFSFFSLQDINSLLGSGAILTGLVTDKLWLLVRSSDTPSSTSWSSDIQVTEDSLKNELKLGVYVAEFNKKAIKQ